MPNYNTTAGTMFPTELAAQMFSTVQGHSALAKLSGTKPLAFNGETVMVFSMDGKAQLVGEGEAKKKGEATITPKVVRPMKFVYQHRVSDEFIRNAESRLNYLQVFADGFAKKIAEGFDIAAMHGIEPYTMTAAASLATNNLDICTANDVTYVAANADANLDTAIQAITAGGRAVTGIALSPAMGAALAAIKVNGVPQYPEFRFGQNPNAFYGMGSDVNPTVPMKTASGTTTVHAYVGDFANAFRWGYAANIPLEVIQYGDPDDLGRDLKRYNEVCLRAEAYIGWAILDTASFARVKATT